MFAAGEKFPDEHESEVREPEGPAGDEIGNKMMMSAHAAPIHGLIQRRCRDAGQNRGAKGLERGVHGRERAQQNQNIDGVGREENDEKRRHRDGRHQHVIKPVVQVNRGKAERTQATAPGWPPVELAS